MTVLLDTHVLLWWLAGGERLSPAARAEIETAERALISPVSCWEVGTLERLGRIALDRPVGRWVSDVLSDPRIDIAPLTPEAAGWAGSELGGAFPGDPADRLLYGTARWLRVAFVSKDERFRSFAATDGDVRVVW